LPEKDRIAYARYQDDLRHQASLIESNYGLGRLEGREEGREEGKVEGREEGREEGKVEGREEGKVEGREEGREEGKVEVARRLLAKGMTVEEAAEVAGVSVEVLRSGV
jgi:predicted transposase YdaD